MRGMQGPSCIVVPRLFSFWLEPAEMYGVLLVGIVRCVEETVLELRGYPCTD